MNTWPSDKFSEWVDWISIVGVVIGGISLYLVVRLTETTSKLRQAFQKRIQLPLIVGNLDKAASSLSDFVGVTQSYSIDLIQTVGGIDGKLISLDKYADDAIKNKVAEVQAKRKAFDANRSAANLTSLVQELYSLLDMLKTFVSQTEWDLQ